MKINLATITLFILCVSISVYPIGIRDCSPDWDDGNDDPPDCVSYYGKLRVELVNLEWKIQSLEIDIRQQESMQGNLTTLQTKTQELADARVRRDKLLKLLQN